MTYSLWWRFLPLWFLPILLVMNPWQGRLTGFWVALVLLGSFITYTQTFLAQESDDAGGWLLSLVKGIGKAIAITFVLLILMAIGCPHMGHDYTPRMKTSEMILGASGFKTTVVERALDGRTLDGVGVGLTPNIGGQVQHALIGVNGEIAVFNAELGSAAVLLPRLEDGGTRVVWTCIGVPWKQMPAECRRLADGSFRTGP